MRLLALLVVFLFSQDETPFKPNHEFELKLNFEFKSRPVDTTIRFDKQHSNNSTGPLPYLNVNLKVIKLGAGEVRVKVTKTGGVNVLSKKTEADMMIKLDLGFTDDIKDGVTANEYRIVFFSPDKEPISRIDILFEKNGSYFVNGERRGKI